jgi:hypothetical protein
VNTFRTIRRTIFAALFVLSAGAGLISGGISSHVSPAVHPIAADSYPLPPVI